MSFWDPTKAGQPTVTRSEPRRKPIPRRSVIKNEQAVEALATPAVTMPLGADARDGAWGNLPLSEAGNAERLRLRHCSDLRFVSDLGVWLFWDGASWQWDRTGAQVRRLSVDLTRTIYAEGAGEFEEAKHYLHWARKSQTASVIKNAVSLLADMPDLRLPLASIDADPLLVGIDGAKRVIDLETGFTRTAKREDFVTRSLAIPHLGDATKCVRWLSFLGEIFQADSELIDWVHRFLGYCLTGSMEEQLFVFLFGHGANGKSVLLDILNRLFSDYARTVQPESLMLQKRSSSGASPDLARLAGARLLTGNETEGGQALAESLIKQLTAGDTIAARELYGRPFEFRPTGKLILAGNHRPIIRGTDGGIWRRIRLIPFTRNFSPEERDPQLVSRLAHELPDIAAWIVQGCQEWQRRGLADVPFAMEASTTDYRQDQDVLGQWLRERTYQTPTAQLSASDAYKNYRGWALDCGLHPISLQAFGRQLTERGFRKEHNRRGTLYHGVGLTSGF
jgi:putative DNA primase/helicase